MAKPLIAVTMGDPAGIGPEVVLKALRRADVRRFCRPVVFGDVAWLERLARRLKLPLPERIIDVGVLPSNLKMGRPNAAAGKASGDYVAAAVKAALRREVGAVVTAPINKVSFRLGGWGKKFVGHTELLAGLTGAKNVRLMLANGSVRAVHVTSHIPLAAVPKSVTKGRILDTIRATHDGLKMMGFKRPRIAVCGLNPHAGDGGLLGKEESRVIAPAIAAARRSGVNAVGPVSPDIVWLELKDGLFDAAVAMYHDQGQIAIKLLGMESAVNVTLGLPIIRTSPAHGTAFDIAGKGIASEASLVEALRLAARMSDRR